jgi:pyruvate formate lyase activating enzyme
MAGPMHVTPAELVLDATRQGGRVIVSTYNEPLITSEWAVAVLKEARAAGLVTGFVSNGKAPRRSSNSCDRGWIFTRLT